MKSLGNNNKILLNMSKSQDYSHQDGMNHIRLTM